MFTPRRCTRVNILIDFIIHQKRLELVYHTNLEKVKRTSIQAE
jgi:hypothetical protein